MIRRPSPVALLGLTVLLIGAGAWLAFGRKSGPSVTTTASVDEIAQAVARELARRERGDTAPVPRERRTRSIPAYEAYLRASDPTLIRSDSGARVGLEYYRKAVALDSNYAAAWMGLGRMLFRAGGTNDGSLPPALLEESQTAVRRALALDDSLAEAHAMLGMMIARNHDFTSGEAHLNHAVALEPDRAKIRELLAMFYLGTGRYAEALVQAERAVALDPRSAAATAELARALLANDRYDEALDRLKPIMALEPPLLRVPVIAAECYGRKKQWDQAISILAVPATQDPGSAAVYGYMLARAGKRAVADSVHQALKARWERGEIHALFLAVVPMARGDKDEAFSWLERALQDGSFRFRNGIALGAFDPLFNDLKPDPRLDELRRRALDQKR